jgi:ABC-type histidine transport system ATPase subunit
MTDKQSMSFEQMYGRMDQKGTPEKVTGRPVSRSSREFLEQLKEKSREQF